MEKKFFIATAFCLLSSMAFARGGIDSANSKLANVVANCYWSTPGSIESNFVRIKQVGAISFEGTVQEGVTTILSSIPLAHNDMRPTNAPLEYIGRGFNLTIDDHAVQSNGWTTGLFVLDVPGTTLSAPVNCQIF